MIVRGNLAYIICIVLQVQFCRTLTNFHTRIHEYSDFVSAIIFGAEVKLFVKVCVIILLSMLSKEKERESEPREP